MQQTEVSKSLYEKIRADYNKALEILQELKTRQKEGENEQYGE